MSAPERADPIGPAFRRTDRRPARQVMAAATWGTATRFLTYLVLFAALLGAALTYRSAWSGDLSRVGDEAAHFVSSTMIRDYVLHAPGSNPIHFALEYYGHLPRVAIGHWPPLFHVVQAGVFLFTGASVAMALGFQAVLAASAAALTAALIYPRVGGGAQGALAGAVAGLAVLLSPDVFGAVGTVMLDIFLSVLVLLTCIAWANYARTGRTAWAVAFALCASAAILTKGNAYGLGLLPVLYMALSGQAALAANWRTWLSAAIVLALTVPWYALTYKISSDGFVYAWGLDYTARAIPAYSRGALNSLGPIGLAAFGLGTGLIAQRAWRGERDETLLACAAGAIGLFLFIVVAPADIQERYLIAAMPAAIVVAALGLWSLASRECRARLPAMVVAGALLLNAALTFRAPPVSSHVMDAAAHDILASPDPAPLVLIAAGAKGEGALTAAFAALDPAHAYYVIRASKALAASNFLGTDYRARFSDADDVRRWIADSRIGWLVLDDDPDSLAMLHDKQLAALAAAGQHGWDLVSEHASPKDSIRVFRLRGPPAIPAEIAAVLHQVAPDKVIGGKPN